MKIISTIFFLTILSVALFSQTVFACTPTFRKTVLKIDIPSIGQSKPNENRCLDKNCDYVYEASDSDKLRGAGVIKKSKSNGSYKHLRWYRNIGEQKIQYLIYQGDGFDNGAKNLKSEWLIFLSDIFGNKINDLNEFYPYIYNEWKKKKGYKIFIFNDFEYSKDLLLYPPKINYFSCKTIQSEFKFGYWKGHFTYAPNHCLYVSLPGACSPHRLPWAYVFLGATALFLRKLMIKKRNPKKSH